MPKTRPGSIFNTERKNGVIIMNYGIKLWSSNIHLLQKAIEQIKKGYYSFIEILVVPNTDITPFLNLDIPIVIHVAHEEFCINISNPSLKTQTLLAINEAIVWADKLNAKYIILHPGYGSITNTKTFLTNISKYSYDSTYNDEKILIENMPRIGLNNEPMVGYSPKQMLYLLEDTNFGFCLDFGHAIKTAIHNHVDYLQFIKNFMRLNPNMFHLTDGYIDNDKDEHLELGTGNYELLSIISLIINHYNKRPENFITIETPGWNKTPQITI